MTEKRPAEDSIEPPETRMLRYLYIGKEYLEYQPGNWFVHNYFNVDRVPSIEEMAANSDTELKPIEIINSVSNLLFHFFLCLREFLKNFLFNFSAGI